MLSVPVGRLVSAPQRNEAADTEVVVLVAVVAVALAAAPAGTLASVLAVPLAATLAAAPVAALASALAALMNAVCGAVSCLEAGKWQQEAGKSRQSFCFLSVYPLPLPSAQQWVWALLGLSVAKVLDWLCKVCVLVSRLTWFRLAALMSLVAVMAIEMLPMQRLWQRRRLYVHWANQKWESIECWEESLTSFCRKLGFMTASQVVLQLTQSLGGALSLGRLHTARGTDIVLSSELGACRLPPDVSQHVQRLLAERWARSDEPAKPLSSIAE
jgi:hypothetical protein